MTASVHPHERPEPVLFTGLILFALGVFALFSLVTAPIDTDLRTAAGFCQTGLLGSYLAFYLRLTVGTIPAYAAAGLCCLWGGQVMRRRQFLTTWPQLLGGLVMVAAFSALMSCITQPTTNPLYGGLLGLTYAPRALALFGRAGLFGLGLVVLIIGSLLAFGRYVTLFFRSCLTVAETTCQGASWVGRRTWHGTLSARQRVASLQHRIQAWRQRRAEAQAVQRAARAAEADASEPFAAVAAEPSSVLEQEPQDLDTESGSIPIVFTEEEEKETKKSKRGGARAAKGNRILARRSDQPYTLPSIDLLEAVEAEEGEQRETLERRATILEKTLGEFNIEGRVVGIECGPRVTMFEVSLAPGIRVERIFNLANNITMALKAYNVRIVAPIPGKDTVGIEIPNMSNKLVAMRDVLSCYDAKQKMSIPMMLGSDITGAAIIADLARMPHLLIAGATGSGKSVCINSILLSYLMTRRPDELKLILVDPKMVELSRFKKIPHLLCPVVTDMKRAASILEWACSQMDQRYEQMALLGVNNIAKFNALGEKTILERLADELPEEEIETFPKRMPYVVLVIDELADLMLVAGKDVEKSIIRLASKSRAVGIHVILATQRPSVDVITGLIKANMPSRIAFQVASKVDSRTILDANGAETLLGAGDMLYLPPASSKLIRAQGVYVTDDELFTVVQHCATQARPEFHDELQGPVIGGAAGQVDADRDELFDGCVRAIIENQRGSVSLLQRKFGIGYGRASRIIDQIAEAGILGPFREGKAREILMTLEEYEAFAAASEAGPSAPRSAIGAFEAGGADEEESEAYESLADDEARRAGLRDDERDRE